MLSVLFNVEQNDCFSKEVLHIKVKLKMYFPTEHEQWSAKSTTIQHVHQSNIISRLSKVKRTCVVMCNANSVVQ